MKRTPHAGAPIGRSRVSFCESPAARCALRAGLLRWRAMLAAGDILVFDFNLAPMLLAPLGTALGAVVRDWLVRGARARLARADIGLAVAQVGACFVAGACAGLGAWAAAFLVAGLAGGLSTWSSLAVELVGWWRERRWGLIAFHGVGVLGLSMAAFLVGRMVAGGAA